MRRRQTRVTTTFVAIAAVAAAGGMGALGRVVPAEAAGAPPVSVFPIVGSQVASPQTQISFRGVSPGLLPAVTVSGSQTGSHAGAVRADSDDRGGSFIPATPFKPGETVTVTTPFDLVGAPSGTYQFQIAVPSVPIGPAAPLVARRSPGDVLSFHSRPDLRPAAVRLLTRPHHPGPADIFLAPQFGPLQDGPMILSPQGSLVWFHPVPRGQIASDFRVQTYEGKPVLTWWQGYTGAGIGVGHDVIYDSSYHQLAVVQAGNGLSADLHEFELTPAGTALITAYFPVYWDASSVHGEKSQTVLDAVVQEIDVKTGLVLFQWDSLDHVPLSDTYEALPQVNKKSGQPNPFDYFHVNSVALDGDGSLIISGRNTWAAYKVDRSSGGLEWTLGGKASSFAMGPGAQFAFQHDVRVRGRGDRLVTMFDDGAGPPMVHHQSRALTLALDFKHMRARVARQDEHAPGLLADFEGNDQRLPDGDDFVGWGQQPYFTEFDSRGRVVLDGRFVAGTSSYRAYRFDWSGAPDDKPAVAASTHGAATAVCASWNGATAVSGWRVLAGASPRRLARVRTVGSRGFETQVTIQATSYVAVQALDQRGRVLGVSPTVASRPH